MDNNLLRIEGEGLGLQSSEERGRGAWTTIFLGERERGLDYNLLKRDGEGIGLQYSMERGLDYNLLKREGEGLGLHSSD